MDRVKLVILVSIVLAVALSSHPVLSQSVDSVLLNATTANNLTSDNLTAYPQNASNYTTLIYDWRIDGTSIAVLNMPFDTNVSTNNTNAVRDYSTFENNGTLGGGNQSRMPVWGYDTLFGGYYDFDNDYVQINDSSSLRPADGLTLEAWVYWQGGNGFVIHKRSTGNYDSYGLMIDDGNIQFYIEPSDNPVGLTGSSVPSNEWAHIVGVWNGTTMMTYVNGVRNDTTSEQDHTEYSSYPVLIGVQDNSGTLMNYFNGYIGEARIYNKSLSSEQISAIYNNGTPRYNLTVSDETSVGDVWSVAVTPNDGTQDGGVVLSNNVTILDYSVCVNETGVCWPTIQEAVDNATSNQTVIITDNGVYNENVTIDKFNLTLTSNGTGLPTIVSSNVSAVRVTSDQVTLRRFNANTTAQTDDLRTINLVNSGTLTVEYVSAFVNGTDRSGVDVLGIPSGSTISIDKSNFTGVNSAMVLYLQGESTITVNNTRVVGVGATGATGIFATGSDTGVVYENLYVNATNALNLAVADNVRISNSTLIGDGGFGIFGPGDNLTFEDSYLYSSSSTRGMGLGSNSVIKNTIINKTNSGPPIETNNNANNTFIIDSYVNRPDIAVSLQISSASGGNISITVINTSTIKPSNTTYNNCDSANLCEVTFKNYMDITIHDQVYNPIRNATINITDVNGVLVSSLLTDRDGLIGRQNITYANQSNNGTVTFTDWHTNHTINVSALGYADQGVSINMSSYYTNTFNMQPVHEGYYNVSSGPVLEFSVPGDYVSGVQINLTHYLVTYSGADDDGFARVLVVNSTNGISNSSPAFEFDTVQGEAHELEKINDTHYVNMYDNGTHVLAVVLVVNLTDLTISAPQGSYVIDQIGTYTNQGSLIKINSSRFVAAYRGSDLDGYARAFDVASDGSISLPSTPFEFYTGDTGHVDALKMNSTHFVVAWGGNNDETVRLLNLSSDGSVGAASSELKLRPYGTDPTMSKIDDSRFLIAHAGGDSWGVNDGNVRVIEINSTDYSLKNYSYHHFGPDYATQNDMVQIDDNHFLNVYNPTSSDMYFTVFETNRTTWNVSTRTTPRSANGARIGTDVSVVKMNTTHYFAIFESSDDGWAQVLVVDVQSPGIEFTSPTPNNDSSTENSNVEINISVTNATELDKMVFDWNGSSYSVYDENMVLMMNFDNVSVLGENDSYVKDLSGTGNDGVVSGPTWTTNGKYGGAFDWNQSENDYIELGDESSLNTYNSSYSIAVWVNLDNYSETLSSIIFSRFNDTAGLELKVVEATRLLAVKHWNASGPSESPQVSSDSILPLDEWHYLVVTYNLSSGQVAFYQDGIPDGSGTLPIHDDLGIHSAYIGIDSRDTNGYGWDGLIDSLRVWNRTLTASEIQQQYFMNLRKYDVDKWELYVNQSKNSTDVLDFGTYTYFVNVTDGKPMANQTETRYINILESTAPQIGSVVLNASTYQNSTADNLTAHPQNAQFYDTLIYDWRINGTSIAVLNLPFDTNVSTNATGAVRDYSTFGNNGTLGRGSAGTLPNWTASGISSGAYDFDGVDDGIRVPHAESLNITGNLSISAWIYPEQLNGFDTVLIKGDSPGAETYVLQTYNDELTFMVNDGGYDEYRTSNVNLVTGTWYYVVATFNPAADTVKIYVNGSLEYENTSATATPPPNSQELVIGYSTYGEYWNGLLDEIRVYDRILTPEQINATYNTGISRYNLTVSQETSEGEVWSVAVTPNDGVEDGGTVLSNNVTILDYSVCVNETGYCFTTIQDAVDNASSGDTVIITDSDTYVENVTIDKNLVLTSNGSAMPTIRTVDARTLNIPGGYNVNISKVKISTQGNVSDQYSMRLSGNAEVRLTNVDFWLNISGSGSHGIEVPGDGIIIVMNKVNFTSVNATFGMGGYGLHNITINNSRFEGEFTAAIREAELSHVQNTFLNVTGDGFFLEAAGAIIDNLTVYSANPGLIGSVNSTIQNSWFNSSGSDGVRLSKGSLLENSYAYGGDSGVQIGGANATDILVKDTIIESGGTYPFMVNVYSGGDYQAVLLNTSILPEEVGTEFAEPGDVVNITLQSYLDVLVNDTRGFLIEGARVNVTNVTGVLVHNETTNASGRIPQLNVTYGTATQNGTDPTITTWHTNHTINATHQNDEPAGTVVNMTTYNFVTLTLTSTDTVCINETGVCWPTIQEAVDNATADQTVVITDSSTYVENVTVDKILTITSNGTGRPMVYYDNASVFTVPDYTNVTFRRLDINVTGTADDIRGISSTRSRLEVEDVHFWTNLSGSDSGAIGDWVSGGTVYFRIDNVSVDSDDSYYGILSSSTNEGDYFINNTRVEGSIRFRGLSLLSPNSTIENVFVNNTYSSGGGAIFLGRGEVRNSTVYSGRAGIFLQHNTTVRDSFIYADWDGLSTSHNNVTIIGSNVTSVSNYGILMGYSGYEFVDVKFIDTTLTAPTPVAFGAGSNSNAERNFTSINSTFDEGDFTFIAFDGNDTANIQLINYLDVFVNDTVGSVISGASVNVSNVTGAVIRQLTTDGGGRIARQNVTYKNITRVAGNENVTTFTNHTINVSASGHNSNGAVVNMSSYQDVTITLQALNTVCVNETGVCWPTIQQAVDNATSGQTVVITDSRTYNENVTIDKNGLTITSNGTNKPTVEYNSGPVIQVNNNFVNTTFDRLNVNVFGTATKGIYIGGSAERSVVQDVKVTLNSTNTSYGLEFWAGAENSTIQDVNITMINGTEGIRVRTSYDVIIKDVVVNSTSASRGIYTYFGGNSNLSGINVYGNFTSQAVYVNGDGSRVSNIEILAKGTDTTGLLIDDRQEVTNATVNSTGTAVYITSSNVNISGSDLMGTTGIQVISLASDNTTIMVIDTRITGGVLEQDNNGNDMNVTLINTTASTGDISYLYCGGGDLCSVTFVSYLDVFVNSSAGGVVSGALVNVTDVFGSQVSSLSTNGSGYIVRQNVTYANQSNDGSTTSTTWYTNHTINVSASGYNSNGTEVNMSSYQDVTITLEALNTVCVNETGVCWPTIQQAVDNATSGQTVVITDSRVYNESVTIDKELTLTSNGTARPIWFNDNFSAIDMNGQVVRISEIDFNFTGVRDSSYVINAGNNGNLTLTNSEITTNISGSDSATFRMWSGSEFEVDKINITHHGGIVIRDYQPDFSGLNNTRFISTADGILNAKNYLQNIYVENGGLDIDNAGNITNVTIFTTIRALDIGDNSTLKNSYINSTVGSDIIRIGSSRIINTEIYGLGGAAGISTYSKNSNGLEVIDSIVSSYLEVDGSTSNLTGNITVINTTLTPDDIIYSGIGIDDDPEVIFVSYLDVFVNDTAGSAVSGATVNITDAFDAQVSSLTTNSSGFISRQNITYANQSNNGSLTFTDWYTNHTINVSASGYQPVGRGSNLSTYQFEVFTLSDAVLNISFVSPTPPNNTVTFNTSFEANVSISNANSVSQVIYNWDGSSYSIYDENLVLLMNFDNVSVLGENDTFVKDLSNAGNDGVVSGPVWSSSGKYGGAFDWNGSETHYINLSSDNSLNLYNKNYTIAAWINLDNYDDSFSNMILSRFTDGTTNGYEFRITSPGGRIALNHWDTNSNNRLQSNTSITLDSWYYVTATFNTDENRVHFYMNGAPDGNGTLPDMGDAGDWDAFIGLDARDADGYEWDGLIDSLRVWNRTLTASEIQQQYFMNLRKYDVDKWELYVNQSKNSTAGLDPGSYTYFANVSTSTESSQTETRHITINANTVCVNETGVCWPTIQEAVDNATSNQTVVITDDRVYNENVTVDKFNLTLTSNGSGLPTIVSSNVSAVRVTADQVSLRRFRANTTALADDLRTIDLVNSGTLMVDGITAFMNATTVSGADVLGVASGSDITILDSNFTGYNTLDGLYLNSASSALVNNTRVESNNGFGVNAVLADGAVFENLYSHASAGMNLNSANNLRVSNSTVIGNGSYGLYSPGSNFTLEDSYVYSSSTSRGIGLGDNSIIRNTIINKSNGGPAISVGGEVNNTFLIDSLVLSPLAAGMIISGNTGNNLSLTVINTTGVNPDDIGYFDCDLALLCEVTFISYLDVFVNDSTGSPVSGAVVNTTDVFGSQVSSLTTNSSGFISRQNITYANQSNNGSLTFTDWYTNHTINASASGYVSNGTSVNMSSYQDVTITLEALDTVCVNETGVCWPTIQQAVDNATAGQTVVITDSRTYNENVTVDKNLTITSNGTGVPTIYGDNVTAITRTAGYLVLDRLNVNGSGSADIDVVDISNSDELNITNVAFFANFSTVSEGISVIDVSNAANLTIDKVNFTTTTIFGMMYRAWGEMVINNSRFEGNTTSNTGAIYATGSSGKLVTIENTFFNITGSARIIAADDAGTYTFRNITAYGILRFESNVTIEDSYIDGGDTTTEIIRNLGSDVIIRNTELASGSAPCVLSTGRGDNTNTNDLYIIDSDFSACGGTSLGIWANQGNNITINVTVINSTGFAPGDISILYCDNVNDSCNAILQNYLDVFVNDSSGSVVSGAGVNVTDVNDLLVFQGSTDGGGNIVRQNVTYSVVNSTADTISFTNHTINASASGYVSNGTSVNMSSSKDVTITLEALETVCIQERPSDCFPTIQQAVDNASNGETVVITDSRTYEEAVDTTGKDITITSNGTGKPTVNYTGSSDLFLVWNSNLNLSRLILSHSGNGSAIHKEVDSHPATVLRLDNVTMTKVNETALDIYNSGGEVYLNHVNITGINTVTIVDLSGDIFVMNNSVVTGDISGENAIGGYLSNATIENSIIDVNGSGIGALYLQSNGATLSFINSSITNINGRAIYTNEGYGLLKNSTINSTMTGFLSSAGNWTIEGVRMLGTDFRFETSSLNASIVIANTTAIGVTNPVQIDPYRAPGSSIYINHTNVSWSSSDVYTEGMGSNDFINLDFNNYLDVHVNDTTGSDVNGASVVSYNVSAVEVDSGTTNLSGEYSTILRYVQYFENSSNGGVTTWYTNHTINASASGYVSNGTSVDMSSYQDVTITLEALNTVCVNETGVCWPTIQQAVDNATAGETVVITDSRTYEENVTVDKNLTITSNGTNMPTIKGINNTPITLSSGARVNASLLNIEVIGNGTGRNLDAITTTGSVTSILELTDSTITANISSHTEDDAIVGPYRFNSTVKLINVNITSYSSYYVLYGYNSKIVTNNTRIEVFDANDVTSGASLTMTDTWINNSGGQMFFPEASFNNLTYHGSSLVRMRNADVTNSYFNVTSTLAMYLYSNIHMSNTEIVSGSSLEASWGYNSTNVTFIDVISNVGIVFNANSNPDNVDDILLINTTITPDEISDNACDANDICRVTFQNYLDVYVNDTLGNAVSGANVTVTNITSSEILSELTNSTGRILQQNITYAVTSSNGTLTTTWHTNHTINVSASGYLPAGREANLSTYQFEVFTLSAGNPTIDSVLLNATSPQNLSSDNLTAWPQNALNYDTLIYDWRIDGTSIAVLNMPFDTNVSSNDTGAVKDYSTYGNNGTLGGGNQSKMPVWTSSGVKGGGYNFDGQDDEIIIQFDSSMNLTTGYTFQVWLKTDNLDINDYVGNGIISSGSRNWGILVNQGGSALGGPYHLQVVHDTNGVNSDFVVPNNATFLLTVTYDGNRVQAYINDTEIISTTALPTPKFDGSQFRIGWGMLYTLWTGYFNGTMDSMKIYDYALSFEQINTTYNNGVPRYNLTTKQETLAGENWSVAVTPNDADQDGSTVLSNNVIIQSDVGTNCTESQNFTVCTGGNNCLDFENSTGQRAVVFDETGDVDVTAGFTRGSVQSTADFTITNSSGDVVASINNTGYMNILGNLNENQDMICPEPSEGWVIRNNTEDCVAYIDNAGDMWLRGGLCYNSNIS